MGKRKSEILPEVRRFIIRNKLFDKRTKIIAAVSGGIDSMTLVEILRALRDEFDLSIALAHVNYGMRGDESDADELFVREYAGKNNLTVYVKTVKPDDPSDGKTGSFQERARNIRYAFFEKIRKRENFDVVATGHTADDNAETVFLNLLRGSGPDGLRGIPLKRGSIVRPLLGLTREDIKSFVEINKIPYRVDSSNKSGRYARNIIRNDIFPLINARLQKDVISAINRVSGIVGFIDDYIREEGRKEGAGIVQETGEKEYFIEKKRLQLLHPVIVNYILREAVHNITGSPVSFYVIKHMESLLESPAGTAVIINHEYRAERESSGIRILENKKPEEFFERIELDEEYRFVFFSFRSSFVSRDDVSFDTDKTIEFIDAEKIREPLIIRSWREADRMQPLGMKTSKKISDIFIDTKIPRAYKRRIPIVESRDGIVWICGVQLDDRFKVTENTNNILKMEYIAHASG